MTEQEARDIYYQGEEAVVAKFLEFDVRLKRLEDMIGMNSSKAPSTDNKLIKAKKQSPSKSKKKRGSQVGSKGKKLNISTTPDSIELLLPLSCECYWCCGCHSHHCWWCWSTC